MQRWVSDLQTVEQSATPRFFPKHEKTLQDLVRQAQSPKLLHFWKSLIQIRRHENHPLAARIQIESLLSQYQQIFED